VLRGGFLWFQLAVGIVIAGEHLFHMQITKERGPRQRWGLVVGALLAAIAILELFLLEYNIIPDIAVLPTLLALDVVAIIVYLGRPSDPASATSSESKRNNLWHV